MSPDLCTDFSSPWLILQRVGSACQVVCVLAAFTGVCRLPGTPQVSVAVIQRAELNEPERGLSTASCVGCFSWHWICLNVMSQSLANKSVPDQLINICIDCEEIFVINIINKYIWNGTRAQIPVTSWKILFMLELWSVKKWDRSFVLWELSVESVMWPVFLFYLKKYKLTKNVIEFLLNKQKIAYFINQCFLGYFILLCLEM